MSVSGEKPDGESGGPIDWRRRRWSEAQKRESVAESREPGVSASVVARRYNVNAKQLFTWRRQYRESPPDAEVGRALGFSSELMLANAFQGTPMRHRG